MKELDILTCGDVADRVGIFFGKVGQDLELRSRQAAERDLDSLHAGGMPQRFGALG
jgi:hypothetical protein